MAIDYQRLRVFRYNIPMDRPQTYICVLLEHDPALTRLFMGPHAYVKEIEVIAHRFGPNPYDNMVVSSGGILYIPGTHSLSIWKQESNPSAFDPDFDPNRDVSLVEVLRPPLSGEFAELRLSLSEFDT